MASSSLRNEGSESPIDDNQLTIRIPNPKVYMARQSLWIGHRGKPRCDHCRVNNLKCDRVLPACNHCAWATGRECKYTPLPTPAHRGIPRCDRCRLKNLKCDRNLPICNHCSEQDEMECNYTPKKRNKMSMDNTMTLNGPEEMTGVHHPFFLATNPPSPSHTFYGQNIASTSQSSERKNSPPPGHSDKAAELEIPRPHTGRFTADLSTANYLKPVATASIPHTSALSFIPHSFPSEQAVIINSTVVEPWCNPIFPSLPGFITQRLRLINSVEIPTREAFSLALKTFMDNLLFDLRETTFLTPENYNCLARCLKQGDVRELSDRMQTWAHCHHLCTGSDRYSLIIMPRDSLYGMADTEIEKRRREYCRVIDNPSSKSERNDEDILLFDRLPVQPQVYDILSYAHRSHAPPSAMLAELKGLGFGSITWPIAEMYARLCPLCTIQNRHEVVKRED